MIKAEWDISAVKRGEWKEFFSDNLYLGWMVNKSVHCDWWMLHSWYGGLFAKAFVCVDPVEAGFEVLPFKNPIARSLTGWLHVGWTVIGWKVGWTRAGRDSWVHHKQETCAKTSQINKIMQHRCNNGHCPSLFNTQLHLSSLCNFTVHEAREAHGPVACDTAPWWQETATTCRSKTVGCVSADRRSILEP